MSRKLHEKPDSIEELTEKRDWMKQIPEQLKSYKVQEWSKYFVMHMIWKVASPINIVLFSIWPQQEHIGKTLSDYELLEEFHYCLGDEDVNKK